MVDGKLKSVLDGTGTVALIVTCVVAIWTMIAGRSRPNDALSRVRPPDFAPPAVPIALDGAALKGNQSARVAMVVYSDFQCPFCGTFAREVLPSLEQKYVISGKVLVAFRHFPLTSIHPHAERAAEASVCALRQGKFWSMHDFLFRDQSLLQVRNALDEAGVTVGLDMPQYRQCLAGAATAVVESDAASGRELQVRGTPTFFLGILEPDHRVKATKRLMGALSVQQFEAIFDALLGSA